MPDPLDTLESHILTLKELLTECEDHGSLEDLVSTWWQISQQYKRLDNLKKELYIALDRLNKGVLPEKFADRDLDKIQIASLSRSFYPITKLSASFPDKEAGFAWLRENGDDALITETVNAGTLASHVKRMIEDEGIDPPEDIVKVNTYKITGSSKYTPK